ncbi:glycosyltransferase family 1 protein [Agromyces sp. C10]|uniref:glycosyltransferase family 4 protein n=1 Tax=Agromyces sp. C10 TaxID=2935077 RepID=UPI002009F67E|nr:glycosyltransferase family 1 protein [Agromyces sp. C10]MCK8610140.1 glycosyltransferase family 4 protein [Agromyces sp. C10]
MPHLILASTASGNPMGAQRYEREISRGAHRALPGWTVRREVFRSMRSPLDGTGRLPMGRLARGSAFERRLMGRVAFPDPGSVVHRTDLLLPPGRGADVVTIHDTVAWRFPDESTPVRAAREEARAADAVICVSAFTAAEVVDLLGVRDPVVVHNGVDERFFGAVPLTEIERAGLGLAEPFVLHTGGASRRKNLAALAEAWPTVREARPGLRLALMGPEHPERTRLFADLPDVRLLGRQPEELVPRVIASAAAVVVPSTYEGFGLPALEAMAAGVPVVAADTSALPEVVGDAGLLVPATSAGIAAGIVDAVDPSGDLAAMVARGRRRAADFSWQRSVQGHAEVWRRVAGR